MNGKIDRSYFFDKGIQFGCTQCGDCCTGAPGEVHLTAEEAEGLAKHLGTTLARFKRKYVRPLSGGLGLKEKPNGDCIFFDQGCTVYTHRPSQCRTYPFWTENMRSEKAWAKTCAACPGIGQGRLYAKEEILERLSTP